MTAQVTTTPSVLYVEDDPFSREVMSLLLIDQLVIPVVTMFADSRDFMPRVQALPTPPGVFLLDIHIKPLSGFEMLTQLRANGFTAAIIVALTASVMSEEVNQLRQAGFDGVIAKPVNLDTFPQLWERLLRKEPIWGVI